MKKIYYYGCSYTAGDELADDRFFPELKTCETAAEYYGKRYKLIDQPDFGIREYQLENRNLAYPNLIYKLSDKFYQGLNFAKNGRSWEENITDVIELMISQKQVDGIILQLGPIDREMLVLDRDIITLRINAMSDRASFEAAMINNRVESEDLLKYMVYKSLVDFNQHTTILRYLQQAILVRNFVESKGKYFLILIPDWVVSVIDASDLKLDIAKKLLTELKKSAYIPHPDEGIGYTVGGHWDKNSHTIIAEHIYEKLNNHFHK